MARRRFVLVQGELRELTEAPPVSLSPDSGALWGDRSYAGLRATDGTDISTRSRHREYMKRNNLTTADDYTDTWARAAKEREARLAGVDPGRKQDIADVVYGRRPLAKPRGRVDDPL
jgi:hypothetical protein